jgi:hypothetical protein
LLAPQRGHAGGVCNNAKGIYEWNPITRKKYEESLLNLIALRISYATNPDLLTSVKQKI